MPNGAIPLFPLPNLVLFPHVDQGLHIFEHRYRQMTADALASNHLIALVLLKPDWADGYDGRPAIEPVACLAEIVEHERLPDGRYNLKVRGVARFSIESESVDEDKLYRLVVGRILRENDPPHNVGELRRELRAGVLVRFDPATVAHRHLSELFESDTPLQEICDQLAYGLPLPLPVKQRILAEVNVGDRVGIMVDALRLPDSSRPYPPRFSDN